MKRDTATSAQLPDFVEPMQAKLVNSIPAGDWLYEVKFDGYRVGPGLERRQHCRTA